MRVVFLGTPAAAVHTLAALHRSRDVEVAAVVTRPDRPRGRSRRPMPSAVKQAAVELGLEVVQPDNAGQLQERLAELSFDAGVVVAFGMILRPQVLALAEHGFLNVHFSLLPRWRGAAPVERAILAGDTETGVSVMVMDEGLDTGPVLARRATPIEPGDVGGSLRERLALMGADLLMETLPGWIDGSAVAQPQDDSRATYARKIEADDRRLSSDDTPYEFANRVRALSPSPGAQLMIAGELHKVLAVAPVAEGPAEGTWEEANGKPVLGLREGGVVVEGIQPPGKRPMSGAEWLRGHPLPA